jgi:DNA-binding transcriptional ArsR family regulator
MSLPAVVQHLKVLEEAGIVMPEKAGRVRTYQLAPEALTACGAWIRQQRLPAERRMDRLGDLLDQDTKEQTHE